MHLIETRNAQQDTFDLALEASSAMGSMWITMVGTRLSRADGRTERLTGVLRVTTEHQREVQRLSYLATRDELTGHLNRNALRTELAQAIDRARAEERHCAFIVASIDRLAVINDGYGFDAGDEVIVAAGERIARTLRSSDVVGRTAGNKFGVILRNCAEREIAIVADRLRSVVRASLIDNALRPGRRHHLGRRRVAAHGCPPPARKPCCARKRRWSAPARAAATAS